VRRTTDYYTVRHRSGIFPTLPLPDRHIPSPPPSKIPSIPKSPSTSPPDPSPSARSASSAFNSCLALPDSTTPCKLLRGDRPKSAARPPYTPLRTTSAPVRALWQGFRIQDRCTGRTAREVSIGRRSSGPCVPKWNLPESKVARFALGTL